MVWRVLVCTALALLALPARASTIVTLGAAEDTRLRSGAPTSPEPDGVLSVYNDGSTNVQRTLLRFDLSSLGAGGTIVSATLQLHAVITASYTNPLNRPMDVYRLTQAWTETGASWNERQAGVAWTAPGAASDAVGTTGVAGASPYATSSANATTDGAAVDWDVTTLVAQWYAGTYTNLGLFLLSPSGNQHHFAASENATPSYRPELIVTYDPPAVPEPASGALAGLALLGAAGRRLARRTA